jgi:transposase-like protein
MYAMGLMTRRIQERLKEIYAVEISPELISRATDEAKELASEWRDRPLEPLHPGMFLDAPQVNVREGSTAVKKSIYASMTIRLDGQKKLGETKFRTGCGLGKTGGGGDINKYHKNIEEHKKE